MRKSCPSPSDHLIEVYYRPLFRFAVRLCGSPARAMELTQRTFRLALDRSQHLPVPANVRGWLFSILFHDFLESRPRLRLIEGGAHAGHAPRNSASACLLTASF